MYIRRIAIRQFRRLTGELVLDDLAPGLNVVAGDNEEGKSTVLEALKRALFDKHSLGGEAARRLLPYHSKVRPEVELDFELAGKRYRLHKGFAQQPFAELTTPEGVLQDSAADERLRELLDFQAPARGPSKPEHHGVWGLLWVEQGTAFEALSQNPLGRRTLQAALEQEVGDVVGGETGRELLQRVRERYTEFFTPKRGEPTGDYKRALTRVDELKDELARVEADLSAFEERVDRLQKLREQMARDEREDILGQLQARVEAAEERHHRLEALRERVRRAEETQRLAEARREGPAQRWADRQREAQAIETEATALERAQADAQAHRQQLDAAETALAELKQRQQSAREAVNTAQAALERQEGGMAAARLTELETKLSQAETADERAREAERQAQAMRADDDRVQALRELDDRVLRARARLEAGATQVELALSAAAERDGEPVRPDATLHLTRRTELSLGKIGRITITPGGADLEQASDALAELESERRRQLKGLAAEDRQDAERQLEAKRAYQREAQEQRKLLAAHAPQGLSALRDSIARQREELNRLSDRHGELPTPEDTAAAESALREAKHAYTAAREHSEAIQRELDEQTQRAEALRRAQAEKDAATQARSEALAQRRSALAAARETESDDRLYASMQQAEQARQAAADELKAAQQALAEADPDGTVELELANAQTALAETRRELDQRRQAINDLQIELASGGQRGLGERRDELASELAAAERRAATVTREAESLRLLYETLETCSREASELFLAPIAQRVASYLRMLLPDAELVLDESLAIGGLRRDGVEEPFDNLSIGTREQLAVLTRLAFAELLAEQGRPATVVLDDALVYADESRFDRMKLILSKAAEHMQIIVLTCRGRDYRDLGAKRLSMQ